MAHYEIENTIYTSCNVLSARALYVDREVLAADYNRKIYLTYRWVI